MAQGLGAEKLPAKAKSAFESAQSSAEAEWELGPKSTYEAHFSKSGKNQVYVYDKAGNLALKKQTTEAILLPTSIGNILAYDYPTGTIQQVYRVITKNKTKYYEVHISDPSGTDRVQFNLAGSLMAVVEAPAAPTTQPSPILASSEPAPTTGTMRGEAPLETEDDLELIDDDIADLFEDEEDDFDIDADLDDDWEDVLMEEDVDDIDDIDLENWDVVEDSESPSPNQ